MNKSLVEDPWQLTQKNNEWETTLKNLASVSQIDQWDQFIIQLQSGLTKKYMIDHIKGEPSLGKQLNNADRLKSKSLNLVSMIEEILGSVSTSKRHSGSYKLLRLLDQSGGLRKENILQDLETKDLLMVIKKNISTLIRRLEKLEEPIEKGRAGSKERLGTKEFWQVIATYWRNDLGRSTHIKRSGGQKNPENKYSGDFIDFAWQLNQILRLETNSKEALGEMLTSTIE